MTSDDDGSFDLQTYSDEQLGNELSRRKEERKRKELRAIVTSISKKFESSMGVKTILHDMKQMLSVFEHEWRDVA